MKINAQITFCRGFSFFFDKDIKDCQQFKLEKLESCFFYLCVHDHRRGSRQCFTHSLNRGICFLTMTVSEIDMDCEAKQDANCTIKLFYMSTVIL